MYGLIIGCVICVACAICGFFIKKKYKVNADFMVCYLEFVEYTLVEIANNKTPIFEIIHNFSANKSNVFTKILFEIEKQLKSNSIDIGVIQNDCLLVDKNKIDMLITDISNIGKYDSVTEINKLNTIKERVVLERQRAVNKYKKDGAMAFKLSILIGVAIMIIFA